MILGALFVSDMILGALFVSDLFLDKRVPIFAFAMVNNAPNSPP